MITIDLAGSLREGTKQSHTLAENTAFMKSFQKGIVEREHFSGLISNLYYVYEALEKSLLLHRNHPVVGLIYFPELNRKANLEKDLTYYYGEEWASKIAPSKAGKNYLNRLLEVAENQPLLLIAHSYVRYLGDLSGGQALKNIVRSALNLPQELGTAFYEFEQIPTIEAKRAFKERYRTSLDNLPLDQISIQALVKEANYAFALNRDLLEELKPTP